MARGGVRAGSGRKAGSANVKTREIADKAAKEGITPLEVMIGTMRALWERAESGLVDESEDGKITTPMDYRMMAVDVAQKAAPFVHPRLANVESKVQGEMGLTIEIVRHADDPPTK